MVIIVTFVPIVVIGRQGIVEYQPPTIGIGILRASGSSSSLRSCSGAGLCTCGGRWSWGRCGRAGQTTIIATASGIPPCQGKDFDAPDAHYHDEEHKSNQP